MYDFDAAVSEHKSNLIQSMKDFGEEKRIHHLLKDIDLNICDYEFYFYKGQQSRQDEVDKLHNAIGELQKMIDVCEKLRDSQFEKLWDLTQAIEVARVDADEDFDLFLNYLSNILKGDQND